MKVAPRFVFFLSASLLAACSSDDAEPPANGEPVDAGIDRDAHADAEGDADTDLDAGSDGDADVDTDASADADTDVDVDAGDDLDGGDDGGSCPVDRVECNGTCIDPLTNRDFCGAKGDCEGVNAGTDCAGNEVCTDGACESLCDEGLLICKDGCVDPMRDALHCGATAGCGQSGFGKAGKACEARSHCGDGACEPCRTFHATNYEPGRWPLGIAAGDLNGDGLPDIAVALENSEIGVVYSKEEGGYEPVSKYAVGSYPYQVAIADLNDDGRLDVIVLNHSPGEISVLLGKEGGGLEPEVRYPLGGEGPHFPTDFAIADLNDDGVLDIVTANSQTSDVSVLLGKAGGGFEDAVSHPVDWGPQGVAIADLNDDGLADIATTHPTSKTMNVLFAKSGGGFEDKVTISTVDALWLMAVADLNGDGRDDIAAAPYWSGNNVRFFFNKGDGSLEQKTLAAGASPIGIAIADMDGDGSLDIVTGNPAAKNIGILHGKAGGGFEAAKRFGTGVSDPRQIAVADFNGDGLLDVASVHYDGFAVSVLLQEKAAECP